MKIEKGPAFQPHPGLKAASAKKEWTVLMYLDGQNDLEEDILTAFLTAEEASGIKQMNLLAQLARSPQEIAHPGGNPDQVDGDWHGVRRYYLTPGEPKVGGGRVYTSIGEHDNQIDSRLLFKLGQKQMSDPKVLSDFVSWGMQNYPAKHYMVVLADHGAGFLGALSDYKSQKFMSLPEIKTALSQASQKAGAKPDILFLDDCLMAQVEVANELKDSAKYLIASENVNFSSFPYQDILKATRKKMKSGEELSPQELSRLVVETCKKHSQDIPTVSVIKLEKVKALVGGISRLAKALLKTNTPPEIIREDFSRALGFKAEVKGIKPYEDYRDLGSLAKRLAADPKIADKKVKQSARDLYQALKAGVIFAQHKRSKAELSGLTIYLPTKGFPGAEDEHQYPAYISGEQIKPTYLNLDFVKQTSWDKVIEKFSR